MEVNYFNEEYEGTISENGKEIIERIRAAKEDIEMLTQKEIKFLIVPRFGQLTGFKEILGMEVVPCYKVHHVIYCDKENVKERVQELNREYYKSISFKLGLHSNER